MKIKNAIVMGLFISFSFFVWCPLARAAALFWTPSSVEAGVGEKITVDLKIDSEGVSFNAAQAVVRFPKDLVEVVSFDKTGSAFNFWLEEPAFSNKDGIISFIGGAPFGVSGNSIQILKIVFVSKSSGEDNLSLGDAAITASDGSGTNILSKTVDIAFSIVPARMTPEPKITAPAEITRKSTLASGLPAKPLIKVSLYPDETKWYGFSNQFIVSWDLPSDISGVSTALNKQPNFTPSGQSEGLFDNKTFAALGDGLWHLHVRFQNNIGWGPAAHYKIAIDTQLPVGFKINILEGEKTDNPAPVFQFQSSDALSGLKEYQIKIGESDPILIASKDFTGNFKLPLQAPGIKKVFVKAVDLAENSVEDGVNLEIVPIASPIITFVPKEIFPEDESDLTIKGTALPGFKVLLKIRKYLSKGGGEIIAEGIAVSDEKGNWEFTFGKQPLRNGRYIISAQSQDARGALSLAVESQKIQVKSKPIIRIGSFQLGMGGALIFLLLVIAGGFGGGAWFYKKRQEKLMLRLLVVKTDLAKVFKIIQDDVEKLQQAVGTPTESDDEFAAKRLQENIKKMEGYLKKEIEKLN